MLPTSSHNERGSREPTPDEQTALAWVARIDRGLNAAEQVEFERWLAAAPQNETLFREFEATWSLLGRMEDLHLPNSAGISDTPDSTGLADRRAAAFLDDSTDAVEGDFQPSGRRRAVFRLMLSLAAASVVGATLLGWSLSRRQAQHSGPFTASAVTQLGELRTMGLPDGSVVRLNTDSELEVSFSANARTVRLKRGEAHFSVARATSRPFTVTAAGVAVRAVGTAFNVRLRAEAVEVLVTEGQVKVRDQVGPGDETPNDSGAATSQATPRVAPATANVPHVPAEERAVAAGQGIVIPRHEHASTSGEPPVAAAMPPSEIERALAWRERRIEFVSTPLSVLVAEFNRYNRHKLVLQDSRLGAQQFGGNFRADDPAGFVRVLKANFSVQAEIYENETHLRSAP